MSASSVRHPRVALATVFLCFAVMASPAAAQDSSDAMRDAAAHFQRAVVLYGETDYRAALVEFKRAYAIAPNVAVLYNIGETQYQLQDYAGALTTFTGYLGESGPNEAHRAEVQGTIEVLRTRVGHLTITTDPPGADVAIDEQSVGKTPLEGRVLVGVGRRKVSATMTGRIAATRFVDVAAADNIAVKLSLPAATTEVPPELSTLPPPSVAPSHSNAGMTLRVVGFTSTGLLAAGAGVFGVLALDESSELRKSRNSYPVTSDLLRHEAQLTSTYSILADSLTAAAVVVGGITVFSTVVSATQAHRSESVARVWIGPASAHLETTF